MTPFNSACENKRVLMESMVIRSMRIDAPSVVGASIEGGNNVRQKRCFFWSFLRNQPKGIHRLAQINPI